MSNFESVSWTDDELIQRALEIREDIETMKAQHAADLAPYEMGLQDIENALLARMVKRGAKSIGTVHGTCYQSHQLRVNVKDRAKWLAWLLELPEVYLEQFMTNHVSKEAVKEFMKKNNETVYRLNSAGEKEPYLWPGSPPPGIDTTTFTQCNIRKA